MKNKWAVHIIAVHHEEPDPRLKRRHVGLQLFDDEEQAVAYATSCEETNDTCSTVAYVAPARHTDREFA